MIGTIAISPALVAAQQADLVLNLDDTPDPVPAGGVITYAVTVENNDGGAATGVTFSLNIPGNASYVGFTGAGVSCFGVSVGQFGPATLNCTLPDLPVGALVSFTIQLRSATAGLITVEAATAATQPDLEPGNNTDTETTTVVTGADVSLLISGPVTAPSGSAISYSIQLSNAGPAPASELEVQFPVPTGFVPTGSPPTGCTLSAGVYTCLVSGSIASGGNTSIGPFTGQVSAAAGSTITAAASVQVRASAPIGTPLDPNNGNNTGITNTGITAGSDVWLTKTRSGTSPYLVGSTLTFTLSAAYSGESPTGLTITDILPVNYTVDLGSFVLSQNGWSCGVTGQTVTCTRPAGGAVGFNQSLGSISIPVTVVSAGVGVINTATISATAPSDPNLANNSASDGGATLQDPTADLAVTKTGPNPALVVVGVSFSYTVRVTNNGPSPFFGTLVVTDNLPAGLSLTGITLNGWTCLPAVPVAGPVDVTCQRVYTAGAPLASGAVAPVIVLQTTPTIDGTIVNSGVLTTVDPNVPDPDLANNVFGVTVTSSVPGEASDIRVLKSVDLASIPAGEVLTYDIEIVNDGPVPSTAVQLTDNLTELINNTVGPTGAGYIGHTVTPGIVLAGDITCSTASTGSTSRRLTCDITTLPVCVAGVDCPRFQVQVRPGGDGGPRTNTANVISYATADGNLANNSASAANTTVLARADVTVTKVATPDPVAAGQELVYVVTALNNGPSRADNVVVVDQLPLAVIFVSAVPSAGSCAVTPGAGIETTAALRTVSCALGDINNGVQRTVTIRVRPTDATRTTTLVNSVEISTTTTEPTVPGATNNAASANATVGDPGLDLLINKTESIDPATIGDFTVYSVTVNNTGPSDAENVVIVDDLPAAGLSFQSHTISAGSCSSVPPIGTIGGQLVCAVPRVNAGATVTLSVTMRGEVKGVYTNAVSVSSDETGLGFENAANNATTERTTVRTRADMRVTSKVATPSTVAVRRPFAWTIRVENLVGAGLAEADTVVVSDNLPAGMELTGTPTLNIVSGTTSEATCSGVAGGTSFSCALGTVSNPAVIDITVPVRSLVVPVGGVHTNVAAVASFSQDLVPANNSGSGNATIQGSSLGGIVFRDFNDNGAVDAGDTGIAGVQMTLTGTAFDASPVARTVTTNASGGYSFADLPEGTYTVSRGNVSEAHLVVGQQTVGDRGGSAAVLGQISGIGLGEVDAGTDYRFAMVPQARVGLAKQVVGSPVVNPDGSYTALLRFRVQNYSLESLGTVILTDGLQGAAPAFGTFVAGGPGALLSPDQYTIQTAAVFVGACPTGVITPAFDGATQTELLQVTTLASGASCTAEFGLRFQPVVPLPVGGYTNQAAVTAIGELSGQTPSDLSQNGANPDPDSDGVPGNNNVPTPLTPVLVADVTTTVTLPGPVDAGQPVNGVVVFRNTGPYAAANVNYTLTLNAGLTGVAFTNVPVGATATYNPANGQVTLAGMPASLNSGEIASGDGVTGIGISYVQPGTATSTVNSSIATTTNQGANTAPDAASATVVGALIADVTTSMTFPAPVDAGQTVTGRVTFRNNGPSTASGMTYGITLDPGLTNVTLGNLPVGASALYSSGTGVVTLAGMPVTLALNVIASGDGLLGVLVSYTQPGSATSDVTSTIGTSTNQGANVAPDLATTTITGQLVADVTTTLNFPVNADAGVIVNGLVVFRNDGPSTASDVTYTLTMTPNLVGVAFGNLPAGAAASYDGPTGVVTLTGMPPVLLSGEMASGNGTSGITVTYVQPGIAVSNIVSGIGTSTNQGANVALDAASASPGGGLIADVTTILTFPASVDAGETVAGIVLFRNDGPSIAAGVSYTLTLTPGLVGVTFGNLPVGAIATYTSATGVVVFTGMPASLGIGEIASTDGTTGITLEYVQPGVAISNVASSISTTTNQGANFAPDAAATMIMGGLVADVTTTVTFPAVVNATTTVNGTISFENAGPSIASGVTYSAILTPGLPGVTFGNLPAGATATYVAATGVVTFTGMPVTLAVGATASGDGITGITVSYRQPDDGLSSVSSGIGTTTNQGANARADTDTAIITGAVADVTTILSFSDSADAGQPVTGLIVFRNNGPSTAANVTYTLVLTPGLTGVSFGNLPAGATASYNPITGEVTLSDMPSALISGQLASGDGTGAITLHYVQSGTGSSEVQSTIATSTNQAANVAPDQATAAVHGGMLADLVVTKSNGTNGVNGGEPTTYTIRVTNLGPSDVPAGTRLTDAATGLALETAVCSAISGNLCTVAPDLGALVVGVALPAIPEGGIYEILLTARVTSFTGSAINTASVTLPPGIGDPTPVNNTSTDTDPISATAAIGLAKAASPLVDNGDGSFNVGFTLLVANLGGTPLDAVQVSDALSAFGSPAAGAVPGRGEYLVVAGPVVSDQVGGAMLTPVSPGAFTGFGAGSLLLDPATSRMTTPAARARIQFTVRFVPIASGTCLNSATASATSPGGNLVSTPSTDGDQPSVGIDVPTQVACRVQTIGLAKSAGGVAQVGPQRFRVRYEFVVENADSLATANNVQVSDDLRATFPTAEQLSIIGPVTVSSCTGVSLHIASPAFDGQDQPQLLAGDQHLPPGEQCTIGFLVEVEFGSSGIPSVTQFNEAIATTAGTPGGDPIAQDTSQNGIDPDPDADGNPGNNSEPTPVRFMDGAALIVTKSTPLTNVRIGQLVPYTITVENRNAVPFANLEVRDIVPAGFRYRAGTATVDGVAVEPTVSNRTLTWSGISLPPGGSHVIRLLLTVGAGVQPGEYVNLAAVYDPTILFPADARMSPLVGAVVRVVPDALFECSDLIGKVFDDRNGNGIQDQGELGIPGVRLVTALGWLLTTDANGRYHVACSAVPDAERGSNFVLKLDPLSLPTGYVTTTENPRTVRLTAGKMSDLTFGATMHRVVSIAMSGEAFTPGSTELRREWQARLFAAVVDSSDRRPTLVQLRYTTESTADAEARPRLRRVAELIRTLWRDAPWLEAGRIEDEIIVASGGEGGQ